MKHRRQKMKGVSGGTDGNGQKKSAKKAWLTGILVAVVVFTVAVAVVIAVVGNPFKSIETAELTEPEPESVEEVVEETEPEPEPLKPEGKLNILTVGLDKSKERTDVIIVASYDFDNNTLKMISVPRDTRIHIGSRYQKINGAYAHNKKGIEGTIEAVNRITGIPIDHYVEVKLENFREIINAFGGVDFDVPRAMNYDDPSQNLHIHLSKGQQHLDGDKAEQVVRFRRYPMGDIDRITVQQSFIKSFLTQKLYKAAIDNLPALFEGWKKNMNTSLEVEDVEKYKDSLLELPMDNVYTYTLPGTANSEKYGASYWILDLNAVRELVETEFGYDASNITVDAR